MKNLYVSQLSDQLQQSIKTDVINALNELEIPQDEYDICLDNALNSKLSDLSDLININKYL